MGSSRIRTVAAAGQRPQDLEALLVARPRAARPSPPCRARAWTACRARWRGAPAPSGAEKSPGISFQPMNRFSAGGQGLDEPRVLVHDARSRSVSACFGRCAASPARRRSGSGPRRGRARPRGRSSASSCRPRSRRAGRGPRPCAGRGPPRRWLSRSPYRLVMPRRATRVSSLMLVAPPRVRRSRR